MKKYVCSFVNTPYKNSLTRLEQQIKKIGCFDNYYLWNENNLDNNFRARYNDKLVHGSRGYGYWVWKPHLILSILEKMDFGDFLLYVDGGCHINYKGLKRLSQYISLTSKSQKGILAFQKPRNSYTAKNHNPNYFLERNWTKGDLFDYFGFRFDSKITDTPQIVGTSFMLVKTPISIKIIQDWANIIFENIQLIDDSPSKSLNLEGFRENRHDQSAFSLICKLNNVKVLPTSEIEDFPAIINNNPILGLRDIAGRSPYKSFMILRITRILKYPAVYVKSFFNPPPQLKIFDEE